MIKPIPKRLLPHNCIYKQYLGNTGEGDEWGADTPLKFVKIEEKTQLSLNRRYLVLKMLDDGSCVFLHENECAINSVKPQQCKGYPLKWRNPDSALHCQAVRTLVSLGILSPEE